MISSRIVFASPLQAPANCSVLAACPASGSEADVPTPAQRGGHTHTAGGSRWWFHGSGPGMHVLGVRTPATRAGAARKPCVQLGAGAKPGTGRAERAVNPTPASALTRRCRPVARSATWIRRTGARGPPASLPLPPPRAPAATSGGCSGGAGSTLALTAAEKVTHSYGCIRQRACGITAPASSHPPPPPHRFAFSSALHDCDTLGPGTDFSKCPL